MARLPTPSPAVRWILTVVVVAALVGVGLVHYQRSQAEQQNLLLAISQSDLTIAKHRATDVTALEREISDLESRRTSADAQEASLARNYRVYTHSIEIEERLVQAASETNCRIMQMKCTGPTAADAGGVALQTYSVAVDAQSSVPPELLNMMRKVSDYFDTGVIEAVRMTIPEPPEEGSLETTSSLSFTLRVTYIAPEAS